MMRFSAERFWGQVARAADDECWTWRGAVDRYGYGRCHLTRDGVRHVTAHRISYVLANGAIPAGLLVCHHCDNPPCVNPAHLFLGTTKDNARDSVSKGRKGGEANPRATLTWDIVQQIRQAYAEAPRGPSGRLRHGARIHIAARFGIPISRLADIAQGRCWSGPRAEATDGPLRAEVYGEVA